MLEHVNEKQLKGSIEEELIQIKDDLLKTSRNMRNNFQHVALHDLNRIAGRLDSIVPKVVKVMVEKKEEMVEKKEELVEVVEEPNDNIIYKSTFSYTAHTNRQCYPDHVVRLIEDEILPLSIATENLPVSNINAFAIGSTKVVRLTEGDMVLKSSLDKKWLPYLKSGDLVISPIGLCDCLGLGGQKIVSKIIGFTLGIRVDKITLMSNIFRRYVEELICGKATHRSISWNMLSPVLAHHKPTGKNKELFTELKNLIELMNLRDEQRMMCEENFKKKNEE